MASCIQRLIAWAVVCLGLFCGAAWAQGVAMAVDRVGDVDVALSASAGGKTTRLNVLDYLPPDAEVRLAAGATATLVYLATAQEWQFSGPGRYRLQAAQPAVLQGAAPKARGAPVPAAQVMAKLEPTQRERMAMGAVVMRTVGSLRLVSPNGVDVLDARPTLFWQSGDGRPVQVSVLAASLNSSAASLPPVASSTPLAQTVTTAQQWTLPAALPTGDYLWRAEPVAESSNDRVIARSGALPRDRQQ